MTTQPIAAEAGDSTIAEIVTIYDGRSEDNRDRFWRFVNALKARHADHMAPADAATFDQLVAGRDWQGFDAWLKTHDFTPTK